MSASTATLAGRRAAEARMHDTFTVSRLVGTMYDPAFQEDVEQLEELFTTKGRVKVSALVVQDGDAAGRLVATSRRELHIPVDSPVVPAGAIVVCTAVHSSSDATLLGARMTVTGPTPGSQITARRLEVTEVVS